MLNEGDCNFQIVEDLETCNQVLENCLTLYICIFVCIYIYREREIENILPPIP